MSTSLVAPFDALRHTDDQGEYWTGRELMPVAARGRPPGRPVTDPWIPDDQTFGARLALIRQAQGWGNVKEAARACGIPTETWRSWESRTGTRAPRKAVERVRQIVGVTGVDLIWLLLGRRHGVPSEHTHNTNETDSFLHLTQVDLWA